MPNSHVPRIELNQDDTINLVVNVYGFDAGTPIEISGQATQANGTVATFYSVQNMPASEEGSAVLRVESVPAVPPTEFVAGFPVTVVVRAAEAWITTLEADMEPGALQSHLTPADSPPLKAVWKENNSQSAVFPEWHPHRSGVEPEAADWEAEHVRPSRVEELEFGILRLDINGSWSVDAFTQLLTQLEQAYFAAATLEALTEPGTTSISSFTGPPEQAAKDLRDTVAAFRLGGGLQVGSLHYGSPGFFEFIGSLNPLKIVADFITKNREINRKRQETKLFDERERQRQSDEYEIEMAKVRIEAEKARTQTWVSVIDRLSPEERTPVTAELVKVLTRNTEGIANDARLRGARMLETGEQAATVT